MEYPYDWDLEWLAVDDDDNIAVFTSAGKGPIPTQGFLEYSNDNFVNSLWSMPKVSDCELLVDLPRPDDYIELSEKGFYTYDWTDVHRTKNKLDKYEIHSRPITPIKLDQLPNLIREVVKNISIPIKFSELNEIDVGTYLDCKYEV